MTYLTAQYAYTVCLWKLDRNKPENYCDMLEKCMVYRRGKLLI